MYRSTISPTENHVDVVHMLNEEMLIWDNSESGEKTNITLLIRYLKKKKNEYELS